MQLFTFVVTPHDDTRAAIPAELVLDILYAHALPSDGLEHVRVRAGAGRFDITLFLRVEERARGLVVGQALFERAMQASPLFTDWSVVATYK